MAAKKKNMWRDVLGALCVVAVGVCAIGLGAWHAAEAGWMSPAEAHRAAQVNPFMWDYSTAWGRKAAAEL